MLLCKNIEHDLLGVHSLTMLIWRTHCIVDSKLSVGVSDDGHE
jgi:hypothetical protein